MVYLLFFILIVDVHPVILREILITCSLKPPRHPHVSMMQHRYHKRQVDPQLLKTFQFTEQLDVLTILLHAYANYSTI